MTSCPLQVTSHSWCSHVELHYITEDQALPYGASCTTPRPGPCNLFAGLLQCSSRRSS